MVPVTPRRRAPWARRTRDQHARASRETWLAAGAIVAGLLLAAWAQLGGPLAGPPLYDGVVANDAYRYLTPSPGEHGQPGQAAEVVAVVAGRSPGFAVATTEQPPQAQVFAAPGALELPPGAAEVRVSIRAVAVPGTLPANGQVVGNVYAIAVTADGATPLSAPSSARVTVILREPAGAADARVERFAGGTWQPLTTYAEAQSLRLALVTGFGEFALVVGAPGPADVWQDWSFEPTVQLPLLALALLYLGAVRGINRRHPANRVPARRVAAFLAGLATIEVALDGIVGHYDATLFSDHMFQHLLLMMLAAPLLTLGTPITVALRAVSPPVRTRLLLPALRSRAIVVLSHPLVGFVLFAGALWVSHFSAVYELSLENNVVHYLEHAVFLTVALLFWWPMVGRDPSPWRLPYPVRLVVMLLQMVQGTFLGVAIMGASAPLYAHYAGLHLGYITPLADQQAAGAIMWVGGGASFLLWGGLVFADWMRAEEAEGVLVDARLDREQRRREAGAGPNRPETGDPAQIQGVDQ
ncbi:MAG TPA: cytochrome c oxidase assembly protein [Candidatus Acidoferrales bacterium]|nr:cytochrome c oxidase assembly protein [Candidatus Acidoferrales bacterium]